MNITGHYPDGHLTVGMREMGEEGVRFVYKDRATASDTAIHKLILEALRDDHHQALRVLAIVGRLERHIGHASWRPENDQDMPDVLKSLIKRAQSYKAWKCLAYLIQYCNDFYLSIPYSILDLSSDRVPQEVRERFQEMCSLELDLRKMVQLGDELRSVGLTVDEGVYECAP